MQAQSKAFKTKNNNLINNHLNKIKRRKRKKVMKEKLVQNQKIELIKIQNMSRKLIKE